MVEDFLKEVSAEDAAPPVRGAGKLPGVEEFEEIAASGDEVEGALSRSGASRGMESGEIDALVESEESEHVGDLDLSVVKGADDVTIIRIDGHLDSVSTGALEHKMNEVITSGGLKLVVDLSRVPYISSGGWGILVGEVKRLREKGGDVVLVGMMAEVYDVYELLGFGDIIKALLDIEAARGYFRKSLEERLAEKPIPPAAASEVATRGGDAFTELVKSGEFQDEWDSLRIEAGTVGEKGDIAVLSLAGIVDTVSAENLRQAIDRVIRNGITKIVVDMSLVEYVSSGGWGTFTERLREVRRKGGDIKVFGMVPDVYYVFTMLGFNIVLTAFDILTEAIEDFRRSAGEKPSRHPSASRTVPEPRTHETLLKVDAPEPDFGSLESAPAKKPLVEPEPERTPETRHAGTAHRKHEWAEWRESDGVLVGSISGSIEAVAVEKLDGELSDRLDSKPAFVLLDLGAVDYISSTGWGLVAKYNERLREWGGAMILCRMRPDLHEIFRLLELHTIIKEYPTQVEALKAVRKRRGDDRAARAAPVGPRIEEPVTYLDGEGDSREVVALGDLVPGVASPAREGVAASEPSLDTERTDVDEILEGVPEPDREEDRRDRVAQWEEREEQEGQEEQQEHVEESVDSTHEIHRIDFETILDGGHLTEDQKLRDIGWAQYGERLKKGKKKKPAPGEGEDVA
jgi:anti-anti-sigma factor